MERIAVIEIDATEARLIVCNVTEEGHFAIIDKLSENLRIFRDMENDEIIKPARVQETIKTLKNFLKLCEVYDVKKTIAFTSIQEAKNQRSFLEEIYNATALKFKQLTAEEKNLAIYTSVVNSLDVHKGVIIDISSDNCAVIHYNRRNILNVQSFDFGALTLTEEVPVEGITPQERMNKLISLATEKIGSIDFVDTIEPEYSYVGVGNAFRSIGKLSRIAKKYPLNIEHNYVLTSLDIENIVSLVSGLDLDKTQKIKGVTEGRADLLASSVAIIEAFRRVLNINELKISEYSAKEGLLFNYAVPITIEKPIADTTKYSLECCTKFFELNFDNSQQVCEIANMLFRELKVLHRFNKPYLKILRIAASLNKCGTRIKYNENEKNSFSIVLNSPIYATSHHDILLAAFVCSTQSLDDFDFANWVRYKELLTDEDLDAVKKLGVLVRLSRAFDRSLSSIVEDIECDILGDSVILKLHTKDNKEASLEISEAMKTAIDFKKVFKKSLQIL